MVDGVIDSWRDQISISLKREYANKIENHEDLFSDRSPTEELYCRIDNIIQNESSLEEKAMEHRSEAEEHRKKAEKLENKLEEREIKSEIRKKRDELAKAREKLEKLEEKGVKTREEIKSEIIEKREERGYDTEDEENKKYIERRVDRKLEKQPDKEELKNKVERARTDIQDLEENLKS